MERVCKECGTPARERFHGEWYCKRHYLQMFRYGHCLVRTIYDGNDYEEKDNYFAFHTYDRLGNQNGEFLIDKEDKPLVKQYRWHIRKSGKHTYAIATIPSGTKVSNQKVHLHKLIMHTSEVVDHINGNTFDNRKANLRVVSQHHNMFNIRKNKIVGIKKMPYKKAAFQAMIMKDYKPIYLGTFPTYEEAVIARLKGEKELFGEFGGQKDLYYILDHPNPIAEIQRIVNSKTIC